MLKHSNFIIDEIIWLKSHEDICNQRWESYMSKIVKNIIFVLHLTGIPVDRTLTHKAINLGLSFSLGKTFFSLIISRTYLGK